jgi:hypothetical protein
LVRWVAPGVALASIVVWDEIVAAGAPGEAGWSVSSKLLASMCRRSTDSAGAIRRAGRIVTSLNKMAAVWMAVGIARPSA